MIKIDNLPEIFTKAMPVLQILENAGFEAYFVKIEERHKGGNHYA